MTTLLESERYVCAALLTDETYAARVRPIITPEDFHNTSCGTVYRSVLGLIDAKVPIDIVTVATELKRRELYDAVGGRDFILDLTESITSPASARWHAQVVSRHAKCRQLRALADSIPQEAEEAQLAQDDEPLFELASRIERVAKLARESTRAGDEIESILASDVVSEPVNWLWPPYLPAGKLVLMDGDPSSGKSYLALMLCSALASGHPLPEQDGHMGEPREPVHVAYCSREDGIEDTLKPRLEWAGAATHRIHFLTGLKRSGRVQPLTLQDVDALDREIARNEYALLVIDPLQSYLGPNVDMSKPEETRPVLDALGMLARKHRCTIILIRHMRKGSADRAIYRGMGGMDIAGAARSMLMVGRDPDDRTLRVMAQSKASIGVEGGALQFRINGLPDNRAEFVWCGTSDRTAEDVVAPDKTSEEKSALDYAKELIAKELSGGPVPTKEFEEAMRQYGVKGKTLERARKELEIIPRKSGRSWTVELPKHAGNGWIEKDAV